MCGAWMTPFFGFSLLLFEVYKTMYCTSFGTIMYPEYISLSLSRKNMYPSYHVIIILQHTSFGTTPPTSISVQTNHFLDGNNKKVCF